MKTLEWVKQNVENISEDWIDNRFLKRLLDFVPSSEWSELGVELKEGVNLIHNPKEWTEENILAQLKDDLQFGIEKAENHRGISASLMFDCVRSWCIVLENGLENTDYGYYGDKLFKAVDTYYGWGLTTGHFDKEFYEDW